MYDKTISILFVEDSEDDTILVIHLLRKNGYSPSYRQVWTADDMENALQTSQWDLIICDFHMPNFTGLDALKIVKQHGLDIPFLVVSGVVGEDKAVEMMLAGAHDYVMKNNLSRLLPAINRELAEAESRQQRRMAEQELDKYRNHLEELVHERTIELQKVQSELLRQERMALLGQLVATVSHEICNPLGVIRNASFLLGQKIDESNQHLSEYVRIIEREVDGANRIISNLSETTRAKTPNQQKFNLDVLMEEILSGINYPNTMSFNYVRNPKPYTLYADRMQIKQVLNNLIMNAIQAAGSNGNVIVLVGAQRDRDIIHIIDTGSGIEEDRRDKIFEPLYTTKSKGTGLGLWISREIVYRHKGSLKVINNNELSAREHKLIGEILENDCCENISVSGSLGACFEVSLPRSQV